MLIQMTDSTDRFDVGQVRVLNDPPTRRLSAAGARAAAPSSVTHAPMLAHPTIMAVRRRESGDTAHVKRTLARPAATERLRASADPTPAPPTGVSIAASPVV